MSGQQGSYGVVLVQAETAVLPVRHETDDTQAVPPRKAPSANDGGCQMQRRRQARRVQPEAAGKLQVEWHAQKCRIGHANPAHQAQGLAVGANQDVGAVIQHHAVHRDRSRPSAEAA